MKIINKLFALALALCLTACSTTSSLAANALQVDFLVSGIFGTNNKPLASGKVYTYAAGTSTASALYSAADKTANTANPIVLDSRGAATAYADGYYKFVIKDKNDVTVATYDNMYYVVPTTQATTVTSISADYTTSSNAELIQVNTAGGSITLNLVSAVGNGGLKFIIMKTNAANTLTVDPYDAQTINGNATYAMTANNETLAIVSNNVNWIIENTPAAGAITASSTDSLSNKSLIDSSTYVIDNSDNTKKFQFQASGIATGTVRTFTVPNYDGTLATTAGTETFTNKTLTAPVLSGTVTGTYTLGGTPSLANVIFSGDRAYRSVNNDTLTLSGGSSAAVGGRVILYGATHATGADRIGYVGEHYFYDSSANQDRGIHVEDWTDFTPAGWTIDAQCSYMKDPMGFVHLKGFIHTVSGVGTAVLLNALPAGYRPAFEVRAFVTDSGGTGQMVYSTVTTGGIISSGVSGAGTQVSLSGIPPFLAAP